MLHDMDFSNFETCIGCIKGKLPIEVRKGKRNRKQNALELILININVSIALSGIGGYKYFITFIDDYSKYGWVELFSENF